MSNGLTGAQLRYIEVEATIGRAVDLDHVRQMAEVLQTLLDEAAEAGEEHHDIDQLVGTIKRLEEQRAEAVTEKDDLESEQGQATEFLKQEHAQAMADLANTADEYRARAEKAEHELAELQAKIEAAPLPSRRAVAAERKRKGAQS
jgi:uncharacterized coiled-coil DUF342 family protein